MAEAIGAPALSPSRSGESEQERAHWRAWYTLLAAREHCSLEACVLRHTEQQAPYMRALVFVGRVLTWPFRRPASLGAGTPRYRKLKVNK